MKEMLKGEVERAYVEIADNMTIGSEEYNNAVKGTGAIIDKVIEMDKIELEKEKLQHEKKNSIIKNIMTGVTFAVGTVVTIWANVDSKRFETGYVHSTEAGRQSQRKLLSFMDKFKAQ